MASDSGSLVGTHFHLDDDDEEYYVIKMMLRHNGRGYEAWCFFMYDIIMGDLQYCGNLSEGLYFLDAAVEHFKKHKGEPPEWNEKKEKK